MAQKRKIADFEILNSSSEKEWEKVYQATLDPKYQKGTRGYSKKVVGKAVAEGAIPPIFLIPRERGGPSYKSYRLADGYEADDLQYAAVSKGFGMQDLSSFTLGPIIDKEGGLCLVNYAHSKMICVHHLEGGGKVDLKRKSYWRRSKKTKREVQMLDRKRILVDGVEYATIDWLKENTELWFPEWERWRKSVALCSNGNFHWGEESPIVAYYDKGDYLGFVEWKKRCYIRPSMERLPRLEAYQFLERVWKENRVPLGLVHPMAHGSGLLKPITENELISLFNDEEEMCCQPYVVAASLLGLIV